MAGRALVVGVVDVRAPRESHQEPPTPTTTTDGRETIRSAAAATVNQNEMRVTIGEVGEEALRNYYTF